MFKIQGADQKEYGPISADVLRQWIVERRADGRTLVQAAGTAVWRPLAEFPEFAETLAAGPRPPMAGGPAPSEKALLVRLGTTSGMAVTSMVLGILGFCTAITGLIGLPLGIISLIKIKGSGGRLRGDGFAIAGIVTSGLSLLMIPFFAALTLPAFAKAKQRAQTIQCVNQMKQLALGLRLYANDNKDSFPPADAWCDSIQSYVGNPQTFQCKADTSGQRSSFAFNKKVAGKDLAKVDPRTVLLFEVEGGSGWNESGGRELMMRPSRHGQTLVVGFADGSVQQMQANRVNTLRWDP
jgi:prepilin-type processing-associated H-X9-DG protein